MGIIASHSITGNKVENAVGFLYHTLVNWIDLGSLQAKNLKYIAWGENSYQYISEHNQSNLHLIVWFCPF